MEPDSSALWQEGVSWMGFNANYFVPLMMIASVSFVLLFQFLVQKITTPIVLLVWITIWDNMFLKLDESIIRFPWGTYWFFVFPG